MLTGTISDEIEVKVPASKAWEVYSSLKLGKIVEHQLPHVIEKTEVVEGDGGVGTVLKLTFPSGTPGFSSYKEKFTVIDHEKMVKEAEVVEGGYLDLGFTLYRVRFEIIEKGENSCITRATIEYEAKEEDAANVVTMVSIQPLMMIMKTVGEYLVSQQK